MKEQYFEKVKEVHMGMSTDVGRLVVGGESYIYAPPLFAALGN